MWTCKHCNEQVEENFDLCWNCNHDKKGSLLTWQKLIEDQEKVKKDEETIKNTTFVNEKADIPSNLMINPVYIIQAGKRIKRLVYFVLTMIVCAVIAVVFSRVSGDDDTITEIYTVLGLVCLICNIIILFLLYSAGDKLEKSVIEK